LRHPWNPEAVEALDSLVERVATLYADARGPEVASLLMPSLEAMQNNPYLAEQRDLARLAEAVSERLSVQ